MNAILEKKNKRQRSNHQMSSKIPEFEATYLTALECESCCTSVVQALTSIPESTVSQITFPYFPHAGYPSPPATPDPRAGDPEFQDLFSVTSSLAPSRVIATLAERLGKDTLLRGSASRAGVAILEDFSENSSPGTSQENSPYKKYIGVHEHAVRGLVRVVGVGAGDHEQVFCDVTLSGVQHAQYRLEVYETGDLRQLERAGLSSDATRESVLPLEGFGTRMVSVPLNSNSAFVDVPGVRLWQLIGRCLVLRPVSVTPVSHTGELIGGIVARSAGVWENNKQVCACSGQTVWEERASAVEKRIP